MPSLSRITVYPIKSLDGVSLENCEVLPSGALKNDRRWIMLDEQGKCINGKRLSQVHKIRATFDLAAETIALTHANVCNSPALHLNNEREKIETWLSDALGLKVGLAEDTVGGFPDDTDRPGPTIVSTATLGQIAQWFPEMEPDEVRNRFRANLEIDSDDPFWEDRLVGISEEAPVRFSINEVTFEGLGICQRCVVPSRHPQTGEVISGFAKRFSQLRSESLPTWAPRQRFDHFFRVAINTQRSDAGSIATLRIGDAVSIVA